MTKIKGFERAFPGSRVVEKSTCQWRGRWFDPWSGKIPHASEQLSWSAAEPELRRKRSHCNEWPSLKETRESPFANKNDQDNENNNNNKS